MPRNRANAKAIEVKLIAIIDLDHKSSLPNPLELSLLISRNYTSRNKGWLCVALLRGPDRDPSQEGSQPKFRRIEWSSVTSVLGVTASNVREAQRLGAHRERKISYRIASK